MDFLTVFGVVFGLGALLGGQFLEGGHIGSLLQLTAAIIVLGGTTGAVMVQFPLPQFIYALRLGVGVLKAPNDASATYLGQIVDFANIVRRQGILALEPKIKETRDPFFRKGLQLLMDGTEPAALRKMLELELGFAEERVTTAAKVFEAYGGYCPTFGIIGAVMGLIHVMENLADPSKLGGGIAVAFVATIYGVLSANLLFLPISGKMKLRGRIEAIAHELVIEGLLSIAAGENPRMIQDKLEGFLAEAQRKLIKKV